MGNGHVKSCGAQCPLRKKVRKKKPGGVCSLTYIDGTCVEMLRANTVRKNNTSGVPGVDWRSCKGMWRASICFKGKRYYLGNYVKREDAVKARKLAEEWLIEPFLAPFDEPPVREKNKMACLFSGQRHIEKKGVKMESSEENTISAANGMSKAVRLRKSPRCVEGVRFPATVNGESAIYGVCSFIVDRTEV